MQAGTAQQAGMACFAARIQCGGRRQAGRQAAGPSDAAAQSMCRQQHTSPLLAAAAAAAAGTNSLAAGLSGRGATPGTAQDVERAGAGYTMGNCERSSGGGLGEGAGWRHITAPAPGGAWVTQRVRARRAAHLKDAMRRGHRAAHVAQCARRHRGLRAVPGSLGGQPRGARQRVQVEPERLVELRAAAVAARP